MCNKIAAILCLLTPLLLQRATFITEIRPTNRLPKRKFKPALGNTPFRSDPIPSPKMRCCGILRCFSRVIPKAGAIAAAIDCEIIELHSHGTVGVERKAYVILKPKANDTTVGSGRTSNLNKLSSGDDSTGSI